MATITFPTNLFLFPLATASPCPFAAHPRAAATLVRLPRLSITLVQFFTGYPTVYSNRKTDHFIPGNPNPGARAPRRDSDPSLFFCPSRSVRSSFSRSLWRGCSFALLCPLWLRLLVPLYLSSLFTSAPSPLRLALVAPSPHFSPFRPNATQANGHVVILINCESAKFLSFSSRSPSLPPPPLSPIQAVTGVGKRCSLLSFSRAFQRCNKISVGNRIGDPNPNPRVRVTYSKTGCPTAHRGRPDLSVSAWCSRVDSTLYRSSESCTRCHVNEAQACHWLRASGCWPNAGPVPAWPPNP